MQGNLKIIELLGSPATGKTSILNTIQSITPFLDKQVTIIDPDKEFIKKHHSPQNIDSHYLYDLNLYTILQVSKIIQRNKGKSKIIFLDRGIHNVIIYSIFHYINKYMKKEQSLRLISQALTLLNNTFLYIPIILLAPPQSL